MALSRFFSYGQVETFPQFTLGSLSGDYFPYMGDTAQRGDHFQMKGGDLQLRPLSAKKVHEVRLMIFSIQNL